MIYGTMGNQNNELERAATIKVTTNNGSKSNPCEVVTRTETSKHVLITISTTSKDKSKNYRCYNFPSRKEQTWH